MPESFDRLTALDNSFLVFENQNAPMHVASIQCFEAAPLRGSDGSLDFERVHDYVASRIHLIPRYRQRIARTPLEGHPVWVDDERFNLRYHLRHSRLPRPGDERQLKRMVGRIVSQLLDRSKPLWEMWLIEGLEGDRAAVVAKTHHCMVDGISGSDILSVLLTPEPSEKIEPPPAWVPQPPPGPLELGLHEVERVAGAPLRLGRALGRILRDEDQERHQLVERARATARMLGEAVSPPSPTPLNQPVGPYRRIDWLPMELGVLREMRRRVGASLNDLVLAVAAGAMRRFLHRTRGVALEGLDFRVMVPVSLRADSEHGKLGNRVSSWMVPLPLDEPEPLARLRRISETTQELKQTRQALGADTLTQATEWTGPMFLALGARLAAYGTPFNMVITNVPGPRVPLHLLGARMLEAHPVVPLMGTLGLGIALFSYVDTLSWGFAADWDLVPDLHELVMDTQRSFEELREAI